MTYTYSFQLYSARHFPPIDAQLPLLKQMGYDAVEPWPPAYEDDAAAFGRRLADEELACTGFHMPLRGLVEETAKYVEIAQALGARYMIPPFIPPEERGTTADAWKRVGAQLAEGAEKVAPHGLKVLWHNHDFEYAPLADGSRPIDHLLGVSHTVGFEIDCGWIMRAGADPAAELEKFAGRIFAIQVKDMAPPGTEEDDGWTATGDGIIDWPALAPLFAATPADHIVTEHDNPSDWAVFARRSLAYAKGTFS